MHCRLLTHNGTVPRWVTKNEIASGNPRTTVHFLNRDFHVHKNVLAGDE